MVLRFKKFTRLNSNGTLDNTFQFSNAGFNSTYDIFNINKINTILVQPDGKILVAGDFVIRKFAASFQVTDLMRLNADGSVDMTFKTISIDELHVISVQPDGKVLGLNITGEGGSMQVSLKRYLASGAVDSSFSTGGGFSNLFNTCSTYGYQIKVLQTGKILISGCFGKYNHTNVNGFIRLNTTGTLDSTFTPPAGSFLVQPDETLVMIKPNHLLNTTEMVYTDTNGIIQETYTMPMEPNTSLEAFETSGTVKSWQGCAWNKALTDRLLRIINLSI